MSSVPTIIYTKTDEAPALATYSFLPIIKAFTQQADIGIELRDISLAGRILAVFPEFLTDGQKIQDELSYLGELSLTPEANIIKLPNISASIPQLTAAIKELQDKGYNLPDYPEKPANEAEQDIKARYDKVKGSAVNPVLREGNSDRRAPKAVKDFAKKNPHRMGAWSKDSKSNVATMGTEDFFSNEKSVTIAEPTTFRIEFLSEDGSVTVLRPDAPLLAGEVLDATFMSKAALIKFLEEQVAAAKAEGVLFSLHMKATMMKVSDPIIFGYCVEVFFKEILEKYASEIAELGVDFRNGFGDFENKLGALPEATQSAIRADLKALYEAAPDIAMVNS
ncbi:MAG: NADP-dependent isocitrate dehydrogenase, partial [Verrucomicrobiota bacterium]